MEGSIIISEEDAFIYFLLSGLSLKLQDLTHLKNCATPLLF